MTGIEQQEHTLEVLNELYAAERKSLLPRLAEIGVFAQCGMSRELAELRRMVAEQARHEGWLQDAAASCDGALAPASADVTTASLHYCDLRVLLPRAIANVGQLVQAYSRQAKEAGRLLDPAAEAIARIYNRHQVHLDQLRAMHSRLHGEQSAS